MVFFHVVGQVTIHWIYRGAFPTLVDKLYPLLLVLFCKHIIIAQVSSKQVLKRHILIIIYCSIVLLSKHFRGVTLTQHFDLIFQIAYSGVTLDRQRASILVNTLKVSVILVSHYRLNRMNVRFFRTGLLVP